MTEFRNRFTHQEQLIEQAFSHSQSSMDAGEAATSHWPETCKTLADWLIPQLRRWMFHLRRAKRPIYLFPVDLYRYGLKRFLGVTWRHPNVLGLRYQNAATRLKISYYRLRNWVQMLWHICRKWFRRHRRQIVTILLFFVLILILIVAAWLTISIWRGTSELVQSFWGP